MDMIDDHSAPLQASNTHHIMKQTVTLMLLLMGFIFFIALFALFNTENDLERSGHLQTRQLLTKALDNREAKLRLHLADSAGRNEAWDNLHTQLNQHWAWDEHNLGASLYTRFGYDGAFVVSPQGTTRYRVVEGKLSATPIESWLDSPLLNELNGMLLTSNGNAVSRVARVNNQPALVAAAWITPEDKRADDDLFTWIMPLLVLLMIAAVVFALSLTRKALRKAKNDANAHWFFYQPDMAEQIVQRRELEKELREAIRDEQLFLLYDLHQERIISLEALVRWRHPRHGLLMPDQFIPLALDKSFIFAMEGSETAKNIVEKIIGLGKDFNLAVTAEGVETKEQLQQLQSFHCDVAQGYFFSRPVTLDKIPLN